MGEFFALIAAVIWASAVILFKRSGETISPLNLNLFRVAVSCILFTVTLTVLGEPIWGRAPLADYLILFASGVIAIAISDTLLHMSLNIVGAGINAIVDCLYSPSVIIFAYILLGERLGVWQFIGMAFIIGGVLVAAKHEPPPGTTPRRLLVGILWGVLSMATLGLGIVIAKPVLNRSPVFWAAAVRQIGSLGALLLVSIVSPRRRTIFAVFRPDRSWRFALPGTVCGSFLSLLFWIAGMKYTQAGTAAILNQSSTIFILLFASLFLRERFTKRKLAASAIAVAGIVMVTAG
jgi:drug/metabolite transporter (DMT)-like permease